MMSKRKSKTIIFVLSSFLIIAVIFPAVIANEDGHHDGMHHMAEDHCDNPTKELMIETENTSNFYTQDEYYVDKATCYQLHFINNNPILEHDVNIDHTDQGDQHFEEVHIHVNNNTDGMGGMRMMNILTPDLDIDLTIYCSVEGHQDTGMEAVLIVGEGSQSSLPIDPIFGLLAIAIITGIIRNIRR